MAKEGAEVTVTRAKAGTAPRRPQEYSIAEVTEHLVETLGPKVTAFLVGKDPQTIMRWAKGTQRPPQSDVERKLRAAFDVALLLGATDTRHVVRAWFIGMNPQLEDVSPAEAIESGRLRETMAAARAFVAGG